MSARQVYYEGLLLDCINAADSMNIPPQYQPVIIAAMIQSDSYNGLRKAILQAAGQQPPAREVKLGDML
jgi:hypothetical protein